MESISIRTGKKFSERFGDTAVKIGIAHRPGEEVEKPKAQPKVKAPKKAKAPKVKK
jgi:hypothetical protein